MTRQSNIALLIVSVVLIAMLMASGKRPAKHSEGDSTDQPKQSISSNGTAAGGAINGQIGQASVDNPRLAALLESRGSENDIRESLQTRVSVEFLETPLNDAVEFLATKAEVNIVLNRRALEEDSIAEDEPITETIDDATVEQVLNWMLEDFDCTWIIHNGVVEITTTLVAETILETRVYDVSTLIEYFDRFPVATPNFFGANDWRGIPSIGCGHFQISDSFGNEIGAPLMQFSDGGGGGVFGGSGCSGPYTDGDEALEVAIQISSPEPWLETDGDGGTLTFTSDGETALLTVRQTQKGQSEVQSLLKAMEMVAAGQAKKSSVSVRRLNYPFDKDDEVYRQLKEPISVEFLETPLKSAMEYLKGSTGIGYRLNRPALVEESIREDEPITLELQRVSLWNVLHQILKTYELEFYVEEGVLCVTTALDAETRLRTVVYDVSDFVGADGMEELLELIKEETEGPWEEVDGEGGPLSDFGEMLIIRQTELIHDEIAVLLNDLRQHPIKKRAAEKPQQKITEEPFVRLYRLPSAETAEDALETLPQMIAPDSWNKKQGTSIQKIGNLLVIRQRASVQQHIQSFLFSIESELLQKDAEK